MVTRAAQFRIEKEHADAEKKRRKEEDAKKAKAAKPAKKGRTETKATRAKETTEPGKRPSRKSTRKGANRSKADAALNGMEQLKKGSADSRFRKEQTRRTKVRGKPQASR
jgi:hypothetical protein